MTAAQITKYKSYLQAGQRYRKVFYLYRNSEFTDSIRIGDVKGNKIVQIKDRANKNKGRKILLKEMP